MNKAKVIISIFVFYSMLIYFIAQIGATANSSVETEISNIDLNMTMPYSDLLKERTDANIFRLGEYEWSKDVDFRHVYACSRSKEEMKLYLPLTIHYSQFVKHPLETIWGKMVDWNRGKLFNAYLHTISKNAKMNFTHGEHVYIFPDVLIHYNKHFVHPNFWVVVGIFDANAPPNQFNDVAKYKLPLTGYSYRTLLQLDLGTMGYYDRYYIIDVIYTDVDLKGLSIEDIKNYLIPSGKAQVVERYGGVVYGENHIPYPDAVSYHQLSLQPQYSKGVIGKLQHFISNFAEGMKVIKRGNPLGTLIEILIVFPMSFMIGWVVYTEIKSFIPFIRGGE